jgi:hypothetical protein
MTTEKRLPVKVYLTQDENDHLLRQAKELNIERGQLIRLRALGDPTVASGASVAPAAPFSLHAYQNAVTAACRAARGSAPRPVLECIAAAVLCSLQNEVKP